MPDEAIYYVDYIYHENNINSKDILSIAEMDDLWGKDMDEALICLEGVKVSSDMVTVYQKRDNTLKITFGDFENNESKALEIGKTVSRYLKEGDFHINWDETINNQIEINPFEWDKSYDSDKEYEIEGAYEVFIKE